MYKKGAHKRISFLGKFLLLLVLFFFLNNPLEAQARNEQISLQYEVKVVLKLIQVYVTDKKGNPVTDLEKDNFIVYDNRKKQSLTEFEKHILSASASKGERQPEEIMETPASPARVLMPRKFFLFFDLAYNNMIGIEKARRAALHFIDTQVQPTDEVGVLSYSALKSLTLHEYLTTDHDKVRDVVKGFGTKDMAGRADDFEAEYWSLLKGDNPKDATKSGYVFDPEGERTGRVDILKQQREASKFQAYNFTRRMTDLAKALRYVPGHKSIIFFSSGIPYSLLMGKYFQKILKEDYRAFEGFDHNLSLQFEGMLKELSAANCNIYALDTQELTSTLTGELQTRGTFSLQSFASATGGKYFGNINNYEQHIEKIQKITGCYYILGYYVDEQWDGKYHKIKVKVDRPGCKVYAQKGYFNPKPFSEYSKLEKMLHLVDLALTEKSLFQTPIRFPLKALPCSIKGKPNLAVFSKIPMEKIQELSGKDVEIVSIIFDKEDNIVKIERDEKDFSKLPKGNIYYSSLLSLNPGDYKCRLVIRNLETGRGAVASTSVIVPKGPDYGIKLYAPLLLKPEKSAFYLNEPSAVYPFDSSQYSPLVGELDQGKNHLLVVVRCAFFGIQQPEIQLSANLIHHLDDTGKTIPVTISILNQHREDDTVIFLIELQIEGLQSGEYFLYLFAEDKHTKSRSRVNTNFMVE